jgi:hypothetical protein
MECSPLILVYRANHTFHGDHNDCGDCGDCGDCACAASTPAYDFAANLPSGGNLLEHSAHLTPIPLTEEFTLVYHQVRDTGTLILNRAAQDVLSFFVSPAA